LPKNKDISSLITLVWTDLVASTEMKQHLPGRDICERNQFYLDQILRPHRDRVEASVLHYNGRVISTEGDSFFLIFPTATAALQWSVDLQRDHVAQPIETPLGPLQVRMGIHTGSPLQIDGDFIGQEVDYLTRIASLAQGSQILLSEVTAVLARNAGFKDFSIYAQGDRLLRGIGTVPIFEILWNPEHPKAPRTESTPIGWMRTWQPRQILGVLLASFCCTALVNGVRWVGGLQPMELWGFDQLMRLRPEEKPDNRLLIIAVTSQDLQQQSEDNRRSSISDEQLLKLLQRIESFEPAVIGLDIYRDFSVQHQFPQLAERLRQDSRLIAICKSRDAQEDPTGVAAPIEVPPSRIGFSDFIEDADGILRRQLLFMTPEPLSPCPAHYAFGTQVALRYLATQNINPSFTQSGDLKLGKTVLRRFKPFGPENGSKSEGGHQMLLNFRALSMPSKIAHQVSLNDVLNNKVASKLVKNRIVLIGVNASASSDFWSTPYGASGSQKVSGVIVQAHMISHLLSTVLDQRPTLWLWPFWAEFLWVGAWSTVGGVVMIGIRRLRPVFVWVAIISFGVCILCWLALIQGLWLPLVSTFLAFTMTMGWVAYQKSKNRERTIDKRDSL
jgi:CHASE2 domain-containing sensor protein/class 3 adenylate cyclase